MNYENASVTGDACLGLHERHGAGWLGYTREWSQTDNIELSRMM